MDDSDKAINETPPWGPTGYLVYKRTYARKLSGDSDVTEEWHQTMDRCLDAVQNQLGCGFSEDELARLRSYLSGFKGSFAGRFLWQLGTETVDRLGLASLQNCAFVTVDKPEAFTWAFDLLMLGAGVGYNLQREYVYQLPKVSKDFVRPVRKDTADADFIVPDSREGWVELLRKTLEHAFKPTRSRRHSFSFSTVLVRGKGTPIKGFGGVASGPEDLCRGVGEIGSILESRRGKQLRPIDCLDILNIIGSIVVAGNVRRSAQIAIGDDDDFKFLRAKRYDLGGIPNWRSNSNNSVVCNDIDELPEEFWRGYVNDGEPYGLINLRLAQSCGRTGDDRFKDPDVRGFNPCAEQSLADYETCCLAEVFLPNVGSFDELCDLTKLLYRVCKHSLTLPCHQVETEDVVRRHMRMGIGVTGYLQATEEQRGWLADCYEALRKYDDEYSKAHGFPRSIKLTTVKPSGTLSLLPGVTPGCHPAFSRYLIRRIRIASDHPLVGVCREHGYDVEFARKLDGTNDHSTVVVSFPFTYGEHCTVAAECSAIDQLEVVRRLQSEWSDNAVSCTVYYRVEELPAIREYLKQHYNNSFKSLSFLRHSDHGFDQAPMEEVGREDYERMVRRTRTITSVTTTVRYESEDECVAGICPVR